MKQWLIIIALLLLLLIGGIFIIFKTAVPKAAQTFIPVKWQNIPLGQNKAVVHEYLGAPATSINGKEVWEQKLNSAKKYVLQAEFRGDTTLIKYTISYNVQLFGFDQSSIVQTDSLK